MRAFLALGPAVLLLTACASSDRYADPQALVAAPAATGGFSAPTSVQTSAYGLAPPPGGIPSASLAAAGIGAAPVTTAPIGGVGNAGLVSVASSAVAGDVNVLRSSGIEASPSNAAPTLMGAVPTSSTGISDEQDFEAVASRETIQSDAARRAQQAAQYQVIQPMALPEHPADTGPNIVEYALNAPNAKGQPWYSRFVLTAREGRMLRNCGEYRTPDEAQRDFLRRGGPERDARGLDPDGDGFACAWDPAPFRAAVGRT